ncbi:hypothetical protein D9M68_825770 [compost metagenome]
MAGALDEVVEETLGIFPDVIVDLPAEKAVFRGDIAFDIDEAQHPLRMLVGQHQRGEATHGMADQVEALDTEVLQQRQGGVQQQGNADAREVGAAGFATAGGIVGEERMPVEGGIAHDVGIVLLGRTEAVQEDDGRLVAAAVQGRDCEVDAIDVQRHKDAGEFLLSGHVFHSWSRWAARLPYSGMGQSFCKFLIQ